MTRRAISTIGYEGVSPAALVASLIEAGVNTLVDVRAIAHSRRRGFAKTALSAALEASGIRYVHMPKLGNPKAGRLASWAGHIAEYRRIFGEHMRSPDATLALDQLSVLARTETVCLLCMEADPATCHRSIVADSVAGLTGQVVRHLRPADRAELVAA